MRLTVLNTALAACLLALPLSAQAVLVVDDDGGPGVSFTDIQSAVDAAAPGDVLLIRSGDYGQVFIQKPLYVVADQDADVGVSRVDAQSISTGELVFHGLDVSPALGFGPTFELRDISVPVLVQDCRLSGGSAFSHGGGGNGFGVTDCESLTLIDCTVYGGLDIDSTPLAAATAFSSTVFLFGSELAAADGTPGAPIFQPPQRGGDGFLVTDSLVFCQDTCIRAGAGGNSGPFCMGQAGGHGVVLSGSELRVFDSSITGGAGGSSQAGCSPGASGASIEATLSTVVNLPGTSSSLSLEAVRREQELATFTVQGQPGDLVLVGFARRAAPQFLGGLATPALLDPPPAARLFALGTVPAGGTLTRSFPVGALPPGASALTLVIQIAVVGPSGLTLGSGRFATILDAAF